LYEDMYWIDSETLQIAASETNCELEQRIVYSEATKKAIRGKAGLVTIHSHPSSFPPSLEDFNSNFLNKNGMGIVCCHDGKVFCYWAKELLQEQKCDFYLQKYYNMFKDEEKAQMEMWKIITQQGNVYLEEV